jgi:hypothetical protein
MPLPSRPVSLTTIDSEWGQAVHDYTFAPSGCRCSGGAVTVTTQVTLPVDTALEDPGGYVDTAGNRVVVPTGGDGLYLISVRVGTITGATTSDTRAFIYINGSQICAATTSNEAGTAIQIPMNMVDNLTAGDIVTVQAIKRGTGTSPSVSLLTLALVRLGAELGA